MTDKEKHPNWDREMREVDKLLAKLPEADPSLGRGVPTMQQPRTATGAPLTPQVLAALHLATWLRVGLGVLLGVGMIVWPYSHVCGAKLLFYGIGVTTLTVTGVWGALSSWKRRMGLAHILSLAIFVLGIGLAAGILVPRMDAGASALWFCPEPAPAP